MQHLCEHLTWCSHCCSMPPQFLNDISLKRPDDEIALLNSYTTIKSPLVLGSGRKSGRKRLHLSSYEEHDLADLPCRQCGTEIAGFRCNPNTIHLQCHSCGGMMPSRTDLSVPQQCLSCDRAFCGVYWHADSENTSYPVCGRETFRTISKRTVTSIPLSAHENNRHEQDITERCIRQTGRTVAGCNHTMDCKVQQRTYCFLQQIHLRGRIAGMGTHVEHSVNTDYAVNATMFVVQPEAVICSTAAASHPTSVLMDEMMTFHLTDVL